MPVWELQFTFRELVLDAGMVSFFLVAATWLRSRVRFFQTYLIPVSLIAGFAGLILGPELIKLAPFDITRMGGYVYHLLALTFIGVGLRPSSRRTVGAVHIGFIKVLTFILQAIIGLGVALLFLWLVSPTLIPAVGMLLPLGFGMGPGIAFSVGQSWQAYGFPEAANVGLTLAAIGFLIAYFTGIAVINRGVRSGATKVDISAHGSGHKDPGEKREVGSFLTFFGGAIDTMTFHIALVGAIYLLSYVCLLGLESLLVATGQEKEVVMLWSFNFIVANLLALFVRSILSRTRASSLLDAGTINRITSLFADMLVATAIMAISLRIAWQYIGPIAVMSVIGAFATFYAIKFSIRYTFKLHRFERTVGLYAEQTGTISSGLALIRVIDPGLRTQVAQDQVLGSGVALALGFPLLVLINMPLARYAGTMTGYVVVLGWLCAYLVALLAGWYWFTQRQRVSKAH